MKLGPISKVVGVMLLGLVVLGAITLIDRIPARQLIAFTGIKIKLDDARLSPLPSPTPLPQDVARLQSQAPSTVAVQVFSASRLVRSGSGTVVSSDGLIVTSSIIVPSGAAANTVYQIATTSGALLRARVVWRAPSGVALLKVQATDLTPVAFESAMSLGAGQEVSLMGATLYLSRYISMVVAATIPSVLDERTVTLSFDRVLGPTLAGARLVDQSGRSQGILVWTSPAPRVVPAQTINEVLEQYLDQEKQQ